MEIRNFCIIAHIDHGKSTLADRFLELTGTVESRQMHSQYLDQMDLEQEKGITIKLQPVRMKYKTAILNLIDTPGHVDFSYEVSRSLAACEGAILVVDAAQGIQAQTLANVYLALSSDLKIIPVVNKIDLAGARTVEVTEEICKLLGCDNEDVHKISAKTGEGVGSLLQAVINDVPPPKIEADNRALIFDAVYDSYRGVVLYLRMVGGELNKGDKVKLMKTGGQAEVIEAGYFSPKMVPNEKLSAGEIGYIVTNLKSIKSVVGDTITSVSREAGEPLAGYKQVTPFVFAGIFPTSSEDFNKLRDSIEKLSLSDSSLEYQPETSQVLGFGFRVGCLGLLHLEIIKERLEREFDLDLIVSSPTVSYEVVKSSGEKITISSPSELPVQAEVKEILEPWVKTEIVCRAEDIGKVMELCTGLRGVQRKLEHIEGSRAILEFELPLANIVTDFYDSLKSVTSGYGSLAWEMIGYRVSDLVRVDIAIAAEPVDAFSQIVYRPDAYTKSLAVLQKLREVIPRQLFEVALQAKIGGKIIARENIKALGKNVTAKLYGGDVTRKQKLLKKQKAGKKRLKQIGRVEIPSEAFFDFLKK